MPEYMAFLPSGVEDVCARSVDDRPQPAATEFFRRWFLLPAPVAKPRQQVGPPAALLRFGGLQPVRRVGGRAVAGLVAGLRVARRVHQRGNVAAGGQDEPALAAEQLRAA